VPAGVFTPSTAINSLSNFNLNKIRSPNENTCYPRTDSGGEQARSGKLPKNLLRHVSSKKEVSKVIKENTSDSESGYYVKDAITQYFF
ncbi:hypothetical protein ABEV54_17715, partial [Peribacillus psychrosaccharolyticus]|uniref:hypothetical protein n=1 Tax=Peribacillus psychrosaccharolyticus TaxID=1407 RepID=UPI003D2CE4E6